jgi:hypothetical protein
MRSEMPSIDIGAGGVTSKELHKLKQKTTTPAMQSARLDVDPPCQCWTMH